MSKNALLDRLVRAASRVWRTVGTLAPLTNTAALAHNKSHRPSPHRGAQYVASTGCHRGVNSHSWPYARDQRYEPVGAISVGWFAPLTGLSRPRAAWSETRMRGAPTKHRGGASPGAVGQRRAYAACPLRWGYRPDGWRHDRRRRGTDRLPGHVAHCGDSTRGPTGSGADRGRAWHAGESHRRTRPDIGP